MDIEIERLNLQLTGAGLSPSRAQAIGSRTGAALEELLRANVSALTAAPAGYHVPSISVPSIRVSAGASDDEIAQAVATALVRTILRELEV